jgi:Ran GTPase-activating protein (RanGAP) involved in mRNA processing and transport
VRQETSLEGISRQLQANQIYKLELSTEITDGEMLEFCKAIKGNTSLRVLTIGAAQIDDEKMEQLGEALKFNTTLRKLELDATPFTSKGISKLGELLGLNTPPLKSLSIRSIMVDSEAVAFFTEGLEENTTLQDLYLSDLSLPSNGAALLARALGTNTTLRKISFNQDEIGDEGMGAIARAVMDNTTLESLSFSHTQAGDEGVTSLALMLSHNHTLTSLAITSGVEEDGAIALAKALEINTTLKHLYLPGNFINANGARALVKALEANTVLQTLSLSMLDRGEATLRFMKGIARMHLKTLDLEGNILEEEAMQEFANSLTVNTTLRTLDLSFDNDRGDRGYINDKSITVLAGALNKTIVSAVHLSHNEIKDEGATALAQLLKTNQTLKYFSIAENMITAKGGKVIAEALKCNSTLHTLYFDHNPLGDEGMGAIAEALKKNHTLRVVNLAGTQVTGVGVESLIKGVFSNVSLCSLDLRHTVFFDNTILRKLIAGVDGHPCLFEVKFHDERGWDSRYLRDIEVYTTVRKVLHYHHTKEGILDLRKMATIRVLLDHFLKFQTRFLSEEWGISSQDQGILKDFLKQQLDAYQAMRWMGICKNWRLKGDENQEATIGKLPRDTVNIIMDKLAHDGDRPLIKEVEREIQQEIELRLTQELEGWQSLPYSEEI